MSLTLMLIRDSYVIGSTRRRYARIIPALFPVRYRVHAEHDKNLMLGRYNRQVQ